MRHAQQFAIFASFPPSFGALLFRGIRPKLTSTGFWKKVGCEINFETMRVFVCLKLGRETQRAKLLVPE